MMELRYRLHLLSDAEPGSGIGTELIDDLVSRDHRGQPVVRATHLKGLMRDLMSDVASIRAWDWDRVLDQVFGRAGREGDAGVAGAFALSDACLTKGAEVRTRTITRTAVGEHGTVADGTLRTTEAVPAGTVFEGAVRIHSDDPVVDLTVRVALLGIEAIGGGRTRGGGACRVDITGEARTPGALLRALDEVLRKPAAVRPPHSVARSLQANEAPTFLIVELETSTPVLCPVTPVVGTNVLRSGIDVPASVVQGVVLWRLNGESPELATALFGHRSFRAWPLLPVGLPDGRRRTGLPVRVSRSHRLSKLASEGGEHEFRDELIEPYDWREVAAGSPLKGTDGVLLPDTDASLALWRGGDIPRVISAHGVHEDPSGEGRRNLFTAESLAPLVFRGLLAVPESLADHLVHTFDTAPHVEIGKARNVRGQGVLRLRRADDQSMARNDCTVFVAQSPLLLPDDAPTDVAAAVVELFDRAGWGKVIDVHAAAGIRFGWNRHGQGERIGGTQRLRARRVLLPGTAAKLSAAPPALGDLMVRGVGGGREQGYGAVLAHPGIATALFRTSHQAPVLRSENPHASRARELWEKSEGERGPSKSQLGQLMSKVEAGKGLEWLESQKKRPARVWDRWRPVFEQLRRLLQQSEAAAVLRVWQDLATAFDRRAER